MERFPLSLEASLPPVCVTGMVSYLRLKVRNNSDEPLEEVEIKLNCTGLDAPLTWHLGSLMGRSSSVSDPLDIVPRTEGEPRVNYEISARRQGQLKEANGQAVEDGRLHIVKAPGAERDLVSVIEDIRRYTPARKARTVNELGECLGSLIMDSFKPVGLTEKRGRTMQVAPRQQTQQPTPRSKPHTTQPSGPTGRAAGPGQKVVVGAGTSSQPPLPKQPPPVPTPVRPPRGTQEQHIPPPSSERRLSPNRPPVSLRDTPPSPPPLAPISRIEPTALPFVPARRSTRWMPWMALGAVAIIILVLITEMGTGGSSGETGGNSGPINKPDDAHTSTVTPPKATESATPNLPSNTALDKAPNALLPADPNTPPPDTKSSTYPQTPQTAKKPDSLEPEDKSKPAIPVDEPMHLRVRKAEPLAPEPARIDPMLLKRQIVLALATGVSVTGLMNTARAQLNSQTYGMLLELSQRAANLSALRSPATNAERFMRLYYAAADMPTLFCAPNIGINKSWYAGSQISAIELESRAVKGATNHIISGPKASKVTEASTTIETEFNHLTPSSTGGEIKTTVFDVCTVEEAEGGGYIITRIADDTSKLRTVEPKLTAEEQIRNLVNSLLSASMAGNVNQEVSFYSTSTEKYFALTKPSIEQITADIQEGLDGRNGLGEEGREYSISFSIPSRISVSSIGPQKWQATFILNNTKKYQDDGSIKSGKPSHILMKFAYDRAGNLKIYYHDHAD